MIFMHFKGSLSFFFLLIFVSGDYSLCIIRKMGFFLGFCNVFYA